MSTSKDKPSHRTQAAIALLCVFALALLLRWPIAAIPLERDEGEYAYIAQRWLAGDIPYKDAFDQKPPGVFAGYAVIQLLFGEGPEAIHWALQIYTLGTITCVLLLGWRLYSFQAGVCATAFFAFMISSACVTGKSANTEMFMVLPLTAACLTTWLANENNSPNWAFITGVLAVAALLFKQVALPNFLFSLLYLLLFGQRRWLLTGMFVAGALAMLFPVVAYFAATKALPELYDGIVGFNLRYVQRLPLSFYPVLFWNSFKWILIAHGLIYLFAVVRIVQAIWKNLTPPRWRASPNDLFIFSWLLCCALGVAAGGYFRAHYFVQVIPPVALLAGAGIAGRPLVGTVRSSWRAAPNGAAGTPDQSNKTRRNFAAIYTLAGVIILIGVVAESWYYLGGLPVRMCRSMYGSFPFPESPAIGEYLAKQSQPGDTVFILGSEPQILYYAHRKSASRYCFIDPAMFPDARDRQHEILDELRTRPPRFIVTEFARGAFVRFPNTPPDLFDGIYHLLTNSYRAVAIVPGEDSEMHLIRPIRTDPQIIHLWNQGWQASGGHPERARHWYNSRTSDWWAMLVIWEHGRRPES
jgi:4-amino-4-deoxy-L-arabinose transferase-like glycosyltransferase